MSQETRAKASLWFVVGKYILENVWPQDASDEMLQEIAFAIGDRFGLNHSKRLRHLHCAAVYAKLAGQTPELERIIAFEGGTIAMTVAYEATVSGELERQLAAWRASREGDAGEHCAGVE